MSSSPPDETPEDLSQFVRDVAEDLSRLSQASSQALARAEANGPSKRGLLSSERAAYAGTPHADNVADLLEYQCLVLLRLLSEHLAGLAFLCHAALPIAIQAAARFPIEAAAGLHHLLDDTLDAGERRRRSMNRRIQSLTEQYNATDDKEHLHAIDELHEAAREMGYELVPHTSKPDRYRARTVGQVSSSMAMVHALFQALPGQTAREVGRMSYQFGSAAVHSQDHAVNPYTHVEVDGGHAQIPMSLTHYPPHLFALGVAAAPLAAFVALQGWFKAAEPDAVASSQLDDLSLGLFDRLHEAMEADG